MSKKNNTKSNTKNKKQPKYKHKNQKGGLPPPGIDGPLGVFISDIYKTVDCTINTVGSTVDLVTTMVSLPADLGQAYRNPNAPGAEL